MAFLVQVIVLLTVFFGPVLPEVSAAGNKSFCGQFNVLEKNVGELKEILDNLWVLEHKKNPPDRSDCGMISGEKYAVCSSCSEATTDEMMKAVFPMLSSKEHRDWHEDWHQSPNRTPNFEGEDFLFFHRQMIKMVEFELAANGLPCMTPWNPPPRTADDPVWPVPFFNHPNVDEDRRDEFRRDLEIIHAEADKLTDQELRAMTLNQLGEFLSGTIHGKMHFLYVGPPSPLCNDSISEFKYGCDNLSSDRTGHVNKHFWKLHGFIDVQIGRWLKLNGYDEISKECGKRKKCYQWKGTYLGNPPK